MILADEALTRLREGNRRFVRNRGEAGSADTALRRAALLDGQEPYAIVLGCSDSRVPAEFIFDQGFGDLFVIRVAGNIVAPSQVGSVEFAAERFGTRLVVVLGHSQCGAVIATIEDILAGGETPHSENLRSIVDRVRPAIQELVASHVAADPDAAGLVGKAVRANVRVTARQLRHGSPLLERLVREDGLRIVGAEYSLETGIVDFFDMAAEDGGPGAGPLS